MTTPFSRRMANALLRDRRASAQPGGAQRRPDYASSPAADPIATGFSASRGSAPTAGFVIGYSPVIAVPGEAEIVDPGTQSVVNATPRTLESVVHSSVVAASPTRVRATGTKAGGSLALQLAETARSSNSGIGGRTVVPAIMLTVSHGSTLPLANVVGDLTGKDVRDKSVTYSSFEIALHKRDRARIFFFAHYSGAGRTLPTWWDVRKDQSFVVGGTAITLTAGSAPNDATSITPTSGIEQTDTTADFSITSAATDAYFTAELVVPGTPSWDLMIDLLGVGR